MNIPIKCICFLFLLLAMNCVAFSQLAETTIPVVVSRDKNVRHHKEIDMIYLKFVQAYINLAPDAVADLYTETADYLAPGSKPLKGRAAILESFTGFFNGVKERGQTMNITFHITQREVADKMGYDVGIYTLTTYKDSKQVHQAKGQFVVVTKKVSGKWYFQLDTYSNIPDAQK